MARDHSDQIRAALLMREGDIPWKEIGRRLKVSPKTIRGRCDPEYRAYINRQNAARKRAIACGAHIPKKLHIVDAGRPEDEPRNPIYDPRRDGIIPPASLTAELLGDPFVGRSELMRRAG
jgi:hypothetical protein